MDTKLTLKQVLEKGIQKEIQSQALYTDLCHRVKEEGVQDVLKEMVRQEKGHQTLLEKYLRGELKEGALSKEQAIDYKIAEHLEQPVVSPQMKLKDVFLLAANREKAAHQFYQGLARIHPHGEVKSLLKELASQELAHKRKVEFLFTEVAFPQTDGG